jgi:hypothetical protein
MPTNFQQSKDVLHPVAFEFISKCKTLNILLTPSEINAINFLSRQLIANNLWDKFKAIYPFVGKKAASHSLNLKNLQRHTIVWYNGSDLKHDEFGVTNLNIGYGNTMIAPSWFNDNNIHVSVYHSTYWQNTNDTSPIIGTKIRDDYGWMHTITLRSLPVILRSDGLNYERPPIFTYSCGYASSPTIRFAGTDASEFQHVESYGFIVGVNGIKCYVNGSLYGRQGSLSDSLTQEINKVTTRNVFGSSAKIPNISQFPFLLFTNGKFASTAGQSKSNIRFASVGYELTDSENKILYNIIQGFQKILNRSVEPIVLKTFQEFLKDQYLTFSISINKILILPTKPYREYLNITTLPKEFPKINALSPNVNISKIEVFGPYRLFCSDSAQISTSVQYLTET